MRHVARRAFTLVEVLIVVVILGVLAAIVVPQFATASDDARVAAAYGSFREMREALELARINNGNRWPVDVGPGQVPNGTSRYIRVDEWTRTPPLADRWDWNGPPTWASQVSITMIAESGNESAYQQLWQVFDRRYDDNNLATGTYRTIFGGRAYACIMDE